MNFKSFRFFCVLVLLFCSLFLLQGNDLYAQVGETGLFIDSRDSGLYSWAHLADGKYWMTTNLNYKQSIGNSWCYDYSPDNCTSYGRLYDWSAAQNACPDRWRLPSKQDFELLLSAYGESATKSYEALIATDYTGFGQRMGGFYNAVSQSFFYLDALTTFWSNSSDGDGSAWELLISNDFSEALLLYSLGEGGKSVRCVQE